MSVEALLVDLGVKIIRLVGDGELLCECSWCSNPKLYVNATTGQYLCHSGSCQHKGNPRTMAKELRGLSPGDITKLLAKFGLDSGYDRPANGQQKPLPQESNIRLKADDCTHLMPEGAKSFCEKYEINEEALRLVMGEQLWRHTKKDWALFPSFCPGYLSDKGVLKPVGIMRAHLERELIPTKSNPAGEKYPQIMGSKHGLFGLKWILKDNPKSLIFTEGWRDAIAAATIGIHAMANSGGAYGGFKPEWLPAFKDKIVYIACDRDAAGWGGPITNEETGKVTQKKGLSKVAAEAISTVAKKVKIIKLPFEYQERHGKDLYDYVYEN